MIIWKYKKPTKTDIILFIDTEKRYKIWKKSNKRPIKIILNTKRIKTKDKIGLIKMLLFGFLSVISINIFLKFFSQLTKIMSESNNELIHFCYLFGLTYIMFKFFTYSFDNFNEKW